MRTKIKNFIRKKLSKFVTPKDNFNYEYLIEKYVSQGLFNYLNFDFELMKSKTLLYVSKMKFGKEVGVYKYSQTTSEPNIYSSAYAVMIKSLYNEIDSLSYNDKKKWLSYFDSFQNKDDGLFYDETLQNELFDDCDWWGARHLALNILPAYNALEGKPKYKFCFLSKYYYHLYLILMYDGIELPYKENVIDWVLKTQNIIGGYGININSSACEDIDSADLLLRFSNFSDYQKNKIQYSLQKAFIWILSNQNEDGGFVFERNKSFIYGHPQMSSGINESSMFATWFRTLSIAYLCKYFNFNNEFRINKTPGYEF